MPGWLWGAFLIALLAVPSAAFAEEANTKNSENIEKLNEEGITAFQAGEFELAAQKFQAAYAIEPDATLLKNEAIAWFKADKCKEAVDAATSFKILGNPEPGPLLEADSVIANCHVMFANTAMAAGDLDKAGELLDQTNQLQPDEEAKDFIILAREELGQKHAETTQALTLPPESQPAPSKTNLGWILTGVGGTILASALIYHVYALTSLKTDYDDVAAAGLDRDRYNELGESLDTARWMVPTLYALGLGTGGAGVYFLIDRGETQEMAHADKMPTNYTLSLTWSF